jgi:hypothetical protein
MDDNVLFPENKMNSTEKIINRDLKTPLIKNKSNSVSFMSQTQTQAKTTRSSNWHIKSPKFLAK